MIKANKKRTGKPMPPPPFIKFWIYARPPFRRGLFFLGLALVSIGREKPLAAKLRAVHSRRNKTRLSQPRDRKRPFLPFLTPALYVYTYRLKNPLQNAPFLCCVFDVHLGVVQKLNNSKSPCRFPAKAETLSGL